jgi:hypothetical protein
LEFGAALSTPKLHRNRVVVLVPSDDMPLVKISVIVANHHRDEVVFFLDVIFYEKLLVEHLDIV